MIAYYGSSISDNMTLTPEGYLICRNVPIGRTGYMKYLAEELGLEDKRGEIIKVFRTPEQLFSKATMASFEGKPVTNNHPSNNLTIDTVAMLSRGHMENVRREGDLLIADLFVMDAGLINEIQSGKREVSCGYDCLWVPKEDGSFEQQDIVGNHVAVVQNGRAGSRVAIKDENSIKEEVKKPMAKISKVFLQALGFKTFAADATPEEVALAMKAMDEDPEKEVKDEDVKEDDKKEVKDSAEIAALKGEIAAIKSGMDAIAFAIQKLAKDADPEEEKKEGADAEFEKLEKEVNDAASDEPDEDDIMDEEADVVEAKDSDPEDEVKDANPFKKLVQDMKPIIMAIPDEKARIAAAKQFAKSVRDARAEAASAGNGYANILNTVSKNKVHAMDSNASKGNKTQNAVDAWNRKNAHYEGGNQ